VLKARHWKVTAAGKIFVAMNMVSFLAFTLGAIFPDVGNQNMGFLSSRSASVICALLAAFLVIYGLKGFRKNED
jgi:hypothetical protein